MIQIKICGITNEKEIEHLNILKPEYIGFVFTKSKRQITGEKAKELCFNLDKNIKIVGVFKDNSIDYILNIISKIPLDIIQLHGKEDEKFINLLKKRIDKSIKIWKALSINDIDNIKKYFLEDFNKNEDNILFENILIDGDNPGSGETFSLENIDKYLKDNYESKFDNNVYKPNNFFLAGGITPENVVERMAKVKPMGIDVSSGVEIIDENGLRTKSFDKIKDLINKVRTKSS